jgi:hypothetical protein
MALRLNAAAAEIRFGIDAEQRQLESISEPLSGEGHRREILRAGP